ncbi:hypothetical protein Hte_005370 [Hypoxylon texense]
MDKSGSDSAAPDRVLPLHFFENSLLVHGNNMAVSLVFDEVLDPEKLRQSLEGFVKREGWQRLGGRLRKNASGKIEWHIPSEFTAERPAITFAHVDHGVPAASHPAASRIPQPSDRPAVVGNAFGWANVLVSACDVTSKPLSWLACQVRRAINEQGTRSQHEAYYAMVRTSQLGLPVIVFGDGGMAQIGFSNWAKAGLFDMDFAPARKDPKSSNVP